MVKIRDDATGTVEETVAKGVSVGDAKALTAGASLAGALLEETGGRPEDVRHDTPAGNPSRGNGTDRFAVDRNLETAVSGLYVAEASVLPAAPDAPPILTIMALARRAARQMG